MMRYYFRAKPRSNGSWLGLMVLLLFMGIPNLQAQSGGDLLEIQARAYQADAKAQNTLGNAYTNGDMGLKKDFAEALKWYARAAEQGFSQALFNIGLAHELGRGVPTDAQIAFKYYLRAAELGLASAQFNVANMYAAGNGIPQDLLEAVIWYRQAAEQGLAEAQFNLGLAYETGKGVRQDETQAARWYQSAAAQKFALAQYNLGLLLEDGRGVDKDEAAAANLYRSAADLGVAPAQNNYGLMLFEGRGGLSPDPVEAFVWLNLAVANGIAPTARDTVAKELTHEQLAAAKRLLAQRQSLQVPPASLEPGTTVSPQGSVAGTASLQSEVDNLRNKNSQLERWVKSLEQALNEEPKSSSTPILARFGLEPRTYSRNEELLLETTRLQQELSEAQQQVRESSATLRALRTENERLQSTADAGTDAIKLRRELLQAEYRAAELTKEKTRLELDFADLTSRLNAREAALATQSETANQAELRRMEAEKEHTQLLATLESKLQLTARELADSRAALERMLESHAAREREQTELLARQQKEKDALAARLVQTSNELNRLLTTRVTAPVVTSRATPHPRTPSYHIVEPGDSLSKISERYYGTRDRWEDIYRANGTVLRENNYLRVGQKLILPGQN